MLIQNLVTEYLKDKSNVKAQNELYNQLLNYLRGVYFNGFNGYDEDILLDAVTTCFIQIDSYNPELASFKTWSVTILRNKIFKKSNQIKSGKRQNLIFDDYQLDTIESDEITSVIESYIDIDSTVLYKILAYPELKQLRQHYIDGMKYNEIVEEYGITMQTVKNLICAQKKKFRIILNKIDGLNVNDNQLDKVVKSVFKSRQKTKYFAK